MRISLEYLQPEEIKQFSAFLDKISQESPEEWFDTSHWEEDIFGIPVMIIKGDAPFNEAEWLENKIRSLPFSARLVIEYGE